MQSYRFEKSKKMWLEAKKCIANGSQGTRMPEYEQGPVYFSRAKGCRMWDVDDNEFIDLLCSIGPIILGYSYDVVDDAVREVMVDSFQSSMNHPKQLELAELLCEIIPCAERVRYFKTGTEATQAAIRLARQKTGRIPVARHGYHGWADMFWHGKGVSEGVDPDAWKNIHPFGGTAQGLAELFERVDEPFAAVVLCPVDTRPFTADNFQAICDVARQNGAVVIFDEIKSGFRVGLGGAQEFLRVTPDLTTISKAMANGYPMAALVSKAGVMENMCHTPTAGTFSVEAIGIAAAIATINEIRSKNVCEHLNVMGRRLIDGLNGIVQDCGIEGALAFAEPFDATPRFCFRSDSNTRSQDLNRYFFGQCYRYGLFFSGWHVGFTMYSHTEADIDAALDICSQAMRDTRKRFF